MYTLIYGRDRWPHDYVVLGEGSMPQMIARRGMSGDIVLNSDGTVNQSDEWLFPWEKNDPDCYARRMQARSPERWRNPVQYSATKRVQSKDAETVPYPEE